MVTMGNASGAGAAPGAPGGADPAGPLSIAVRVKPGAARTVVGGRYEGSLGPALVVRVQARAVDGRATEAARLAVADALGVRPASVALRTGATSRDKVFVVANPPAGVAERLRDLRDGGQ
jgi:uncharacterized protein YggU (UPF0235/DUF167 family)